MRSGADDGGRSDSEEWALPLCVTIVGIQTIGALGLAEVAQTLAASVFARRFSPWAAKVWRLRLLGGYPRGES